MGFEIKTKTKKVEASLQEEILAAEKLLKNTSRSYNLQDMAKIYDLYNRLTNDHKKDSGCGTCRRKVLNVMTAEWQRLNKIKEEKNKEKENGK